MNEMNAEWAWRAVLLDLRQRQPEELTDTLPGTFTARKLQWLHGIACRYAKPQLSCAKWQLSEPEPPELSWRRDHEDDGLELVTADYVCSGCTRPAVSIGDLLEKLFAKSAEDSHDERIWRRYANERLPMKPDLFRQIVANALAEGWLGPWQALSLWLNIVELQAAKRALKRVLARAKERTAYLTEGRLDMSEEELMAEYRVQIDSLTDAGYERFERRQRSMVPLDLPADFLAWLWDVESDDGNA